MLDTVIILLTTIFLAIVLVYFYKSPAGKHYINSYISKTGYWDTVLMVFLLIAFNVVSFRWMGWIGLVMPWTIIDDIVFIGATITSYRRVKNTKRTLPKINKVIILKKYDFSLILSI